MNVLSSREYNYNYIPNHLPYLARPSKRGIAADKGNSALLT